MENLSEELKAEVTVLNKRGLHLRFAGGIAAVATKFSSEIIISKGRKNVNAKSILDLLSLSAAPGVKLSIKVSGTDAKAALEAIQACFEPCCKE